MPDPYTMVDARTEIQEPDGTGDYTAYFSGTSASCPLAAGVVALVFSINPELTGPQARAIVEGTADKVGGVAYDGNGHEEHYGFGRVNAARAVRAARRGFSVPQGGLCAEDLNCGDEFGAAAGAVCAKGSGQPEGVCVAACAAQVDCGDRGVCTPLPAGGSGCWPACAGHGDCAGGVVCASGLCQAVACGADAACPEGSSCGPEGLCRAGGGGGCGCGGAGAASALWGVPLLAASSLRRRRPRS
jgi:hypothetical protein